MSEKGPENQPAETTEPTEPTEPDVTARSADTDRVPEASRWHVAMREITTGNALVAVLSVVLAMFFGSLMILFTDEDVRYGLSYFFARPSDTFFYAWEAISGAYVSL
ncbi:MAG TPA: ABC transporter permease, partial [Nocardioides sp.]